MIEIQSAHKDVPQPAAPAQRTRSDNHLALSVARERVCAALTTP